MNYELWFYVLVAFVVGRISKGFNIYVGTDKIKYENATFGVLLREK